MTDYSAPIHVLAGEVAKTFGGTVIPFDDYAEYRSRIRVEPFNDTPGYIIQLTTNSYGVKKDYVTVSIDPIELNNQVSIRGLLFPEASMSMSRDIQAICADISRRVVNHPITIRSLKEYEKRLRDQNAKEITLEGHIRELLAACPSLALTQRSEISNGSVGLYNKPDHGESFNMTLYASGEITFDKLYSLTFDKAKRIIAILTEV